jgi:hypothetical protein
MQASSQSEKPTVWFPQWSTALQQLRLPPLRRQQYRLALIRYLQFCKQTHQQATVESARQFMESVHAKRMLGVSMLATWKEALNWFFREGQKPSVSVPIATTRRPPPSGEVMSDVPPTAAADLGATEWEQRLIRELRSRHYQWRTEQTYRGWAHRFAKWLNPRGVSVGDATNEHIRDFLSDLATRQRVSASTQKQALNALVFLLREALARDPGEFGDFTRARKPVRMPDVLTRDECQRLFAALEGTPRLMAELMYGSGVRLLELLRLRVKDMVDRAVGFRLSAIG